LSARRSTRFKAPSLRGAIGRAEGTTTALGQLVGTNTQVRISGWLMLDQEHPEQINKTRETL